jgi:hypothetical protein
VAQVAEEPDKFKAATLMRRLLVLVEPEEQLILGGMMRLPRASKASMAAEAQAVVAEAVAGQRPLVERPEEMERPDKTGATARLSLCGFSKCVTI